MASDQWSVLFPYDSAVRRFSSIPTHEQDAAHTNLATSPRYPRSENCDPKSVSADEDDVTFDGGQSQAPQTIPRLSSTKRAAASLGARGPVHAERVQGKGFVFDYPLGSGQVCVVWCQHCDFYSITEPSIYNSSFALHCKMSSKHKELPVEMQGPFRSYHHVVELFGYRVEDATKTWAWDNNQRLIRDKLRSSKHRKSGPWKKSKTVSKKKRRPIQPSRDSENETHKDLSSDTEDEEPLEAAPAIDSNDTLEPEQFNDEVESVMADGAHLEQDNQDMDVEANFKYETPDDYNLDYQLPDDQGPWIVFTRAQEHQRGYQVY